MGAGGQAIADLWPGIEKTPDVAGGAACVAGTRLPVWVLERSRRLGSTEAQLLGRYPALRTVDLARAWAYVDGHREEIEAAIQAHDAY